MVVSRFNGFENGISLPSFEIFFKFWEEVYLIFSFGKIIGLAMAARHS
jgi:hypothetical protein